jgi:hypothetical protein
VPALRLTLAVRSILIVVTVRAQAIIGRWLLGVVRGASIGDMPDAVVLHLVQVADQAQRNAPG